MARGQQEKAAPGNTGFRKFIRIFWTALTYPFVLLAALLGAIVGAIAGIFSGVTTKRGVWIGLRSGFCTVLFILAMPTGRT